MVYINRKNIKTMRLSNKLDHIKIRPFLIDKVLRDISYRVRLPKHMKIYQVFYAALLELAKGKHKQTKKEDMRVHLRMKFFLKIWTGCKY